MTSSRSHAQAPVSDCCGAPVTVTGKVTSMYYVCRACGQPCDEGERRPASMLRQIDFALDDDEADLKRVPMCPVTEAEEAGNVW